MSVRSLIRPSERCCHRSHRLRLPCLREWAYDCHCIHHNRTCFSSCPSEPGTYPCDCGEDTIAGCAERPSRHCGNTPEPGT